MYFVPNMSFKMSAEFKMASIEKDKSGLGEKRADGDYEV